MNYSRIKDQNMIKAMSRSTSLRVIFGADCESTSIRFFMKNLIGIKRSYCFFGNIGSMEWTSTQSKRSNLMVGQMAMTVDLRIAMGTALSNNQIDHSIWASHMMRICPDDKVGACWQEKYISDDFHSWGDLSLVYSGNMGHRCVFTIPNIFGTFTAPE